METYAYIRVSTQEQNIPTKREAFVLMKSSAGPFLLARTPMICYTVNKKSRKTQSGGVQE